MTSPHPRTHRRSLMIVGLAAVGLVLVGVTSCWALDILIDVAPGVLNLQNNGQVVTVHTSLPYSQVTGASVTLNGLPISWWKADNRGYFVAKFNIDDVKNLPGLIVDEYNTLSLTGVNIDGEEFTGSAEILVINRSGK